MTPEQDRDVLEITLKAYPWFKSAILESDDGGHHVVVRVTSFGDMNNCMFVRPWTSSKVCYVSGN